MKTQTTMYVVVNTWPLFSHLNHTTTWIKEPNPGESET